MKQIIVYLREEDLLSGMVAMILKGYNCPSTIVHSTHAVRELISDGEDQLLIMNSINSGNTKGVTEFVDEVKTQSKTLKVASFSAMGLVGDFDYDIPRHSGEWMPSLRYAIELFLSGRIKRRNSTAHKPYLLPVAA